MDPIHVQLWSVHVHKVRHKFDFANSAMTYTTAPRTLHHRVFYRLNFWLILDQCLVALGEWNIGYHTTLLHLELCSVLPPPAVRVYPTVHISRSLFQTVFFGSPLPLWPCDIHWSACRAMLSSHLFRVSVPNPSPLSSSYLVQHILTPQSYCRCQHYWHSGTLQQNCISPKLPSCRDSGYNFPLLYWHHVATEEDNDKRTPGKKIWRRGQQDTSSAGGRWRRQHRTELKTDNNDLSPIFHRRRIVLTRYSSY